MYIATWRSRKKIGQKKDSQYNVYMYKERDKKPIYTYSSE